MTAIAFDAKDLAALPMEVLGRLFDSGDPATCQAVQAECERRDRADAKARQAKARQQGDADAWREAAWAQYLDAEQVTRGYLLSAQGEAEGISEPFVLWTGTERWAMARASEELRNYWLDHPRLTVTAYRRQLREAARIARDDAERDAMDAEVAAPVSPAPAPAPVRVTQPAPEPQPAPRPAPPLPVPPADPDPAYRALWAAATTAAERVTAAQAFTDYLTQRAAHRRARFAQLLNR